MAMKTPEGSGATVGTRGPSYSPFRAFQSQDFTLLWASSLLSMATFFMLLITRGQYMLDLTDSAFMVSAIQAVPGLPMLFLAPFGGVIADRINRKTVLITAEVVNLVVNAGLALLILTEAVQVWHIFVLATINGIAFAASMPSRMAAVPNLLRPEDISSGVALITTVFSGAMLVGPALAGFLMSSFGMGVAFLVPALALIPVLSLLLLIHIQHQPDPQQTGVSVLRSIWEGLVWTRRQPVIMALLLTGLGVTVFAIPYQAMLPIFSRNILTEPGLSLGLWGIPPALYGALDPRLGLGIIGATAGLGSLVGSLIVAAFGESRYKGWLLRVGGLGTGILLIFFSLSPVFLLTIILALLLGFLLQLFMTSNFTLVQVLSPDYVRGRVLSIRLVIIGLVPAGQFLLGALAELFGAGFATAVMGALSVFFVLGVLAAYPSLRRM